MKTWFTENKTKLCGCTNDKSLEEIFCDDCANYWQSILKRDHLPFANKNNKIDWMNEVLNHWIVAVKARHKDKETLSKLGEQKGDKGAR